MCNVHKKIKIGQVLSVRSKGRKFDSLYIAHCIELLCWTKLWSNGMRLVWWILCYALKDELFKYIHCTVHTIDVLLML